MGNFFDKYGNEVKVFDKNGNEILANPTKSDMTGAIEKLLKTGMAMGPIATEKEMLYAIVPEGAELITEDLAERNEEFEKRRTELETGRPLRNTGKVHVTDVESFILMVKREMIKETTMVTSDMNKKGFVAIIDFAEDGKKGGFGEREIVFALEETTEFKRWKAMNRKRMTQMELADFLEENLESIADPPSGEMIQMISELKVKRRASYHSVIDTQSGMQSMSYSEEIKGETHQGSMDFVGKFTIAVQPFIGSKPYRIECNLRFSIDGERLQIFFSMINIAMIEEHAWGVEREKVKEELVHLGLPLINIR